jgi:hypothetical protein
MARFDLVAPFTAAIMFYAITPLLGRQVKAAVQRVIASGLRHVGEVREEDIPYYLSADSIDEYVDFAADAVQVFPVFLLPIVGAIYAFSSSTPAGVSVTLLLAAVVLAIGMNAWITSSSPTDYVSRKWHGYSPITLIGMLFNIVALILVLILS